MTAYEHSAAQTTAPAAGQSRYAKNIARYGSATIAGSASIYDAIAVMVKRNLSGLPVVDKTGLAGMISEKDALKLVFHNQFVAGTVADYMTTNIVSFDENTEISEICRCLANSGFRRVPIMQRGRLAAVISRADLIRANLHRFEPARPQAPDSRSTKDPKARDAMKPGLLTVREQTSLYDAMNILVTWDISGLAVVDDCMNLLGVITEKDMLKTAYAPDAKAGLVREHMTRDVISFSPTDSLLEVCNCLIDNSFRRVFIVEGGKLVGIISRTDIMGYLLKNRSSMFKDTGSN